MITAYQLAPIALFAYNRPQHLRRTVEALAGNALAAESELFVFLDGPKNDSDRILNSEIRDYVLSLNEFLSVSLIEQEQNLGLAASITGGVSRLLETHESVIVMEDDILTSPFFLRYMNDALNAYRNERTVASVHGFMYEVAGLPETFFLKGADCWGWATWSRAWQVFDANGERLLESLITEGLVEGFDLDGAMPNTQMLRDQISSRNDSWAIRWHASTFRKGMLTLHPGRSLVQNIGLDGSGTHCLDVPPHLDVRAAAGPVCVERLPIAENAMARKSIIEFLRTQSPKRVGKTGLISRIIRALGVEKFIRQ